jgi:hypothetical protein
MTLFRRFMNPDPRAKPGLEEASLKLTEEARRLAFGGFDGAQDSGPSREAGRESASTFHDLLPRLRRLMRPWPAKTAIAAVIGLLLVVVLRQAGTPTHEIPDQINLRGFERPSLTASNPERMPDGTVRFVWDDIEGVDEYLLVVLDDHRNELIRFDVRAATSISVDPAAIPGFGEPDAVYLWRVIAIQEGDEVGRSGLRSLVLRSP